jgi:integrase
MSIGTYRTKADADAAFAKALADQGRGAFIPPERGRITLREYAPHWAETRLTRKGEPLRPRVLELYEGLLRLHIFPALGDAALVRLTPATIRSWHSERLANGPGSSTAAKSYRLLRAILTTAIEDGLIATNPCTIKGAGVEPSEEREIPTVEQVYALADAVSPRFRAAVLLAAFGGLRKGELFGLIRRQVDLLHRTVKIEVQRQQGAHGQELIGPPKTLPASARSPSRSRSFRGSRSTSTVGQPRASTVWCSSVRKAVRFDRTCSSRTGSEPADHSGLTTFASTTFATSPAPSPRLPVPVRRS